MFSTPGTALAYPLFFPSAVLPYTPLGTSRVYAQTFYIRIPGQRVKHLLLIAVIYFGKKSDDSELYLRHCYLLFFLQSPIFSAWAISSSRKSGWAMEMIFSARSQVEAPFRFTMPYSVTR